MMAHRHERRASAWTAFFALAHGLGAQTPADAVATWHGKSRSIEATVAQTDLGPDAIAALQRWGPWALLRGYRLVLSDDGRVVLVLSPTYARRAQGHKEDNTVARFVASVERTLAEVDRLLPPVPNVDARRTVVVAGVQQQHYSALLDAIAARDERLRDWAARVAPTRSGFTLSDPLVGVWIEDPPETEEWNAENELVHRLAAELLAEHAADLPRWLQIGLAWHVEERVMRSLYCFPYRTGFVSIYDHTDWDRALQQKFKTRRKAPLQLEEVAGWDPRGGLDQDRAYLAFGVARFLADYETSAVPALLQDLQAQVAARQRVATSETTWTTNPDYMLPVADQLAALEKHAGDSLLARVTEYFIQGKKYRPAGR